MTIYMDDNIYLQEEAFIPDHAVQAVGFTSRRPRERHYYFQLRQFQNVSRLQRDSRSRKARILTTGIHLVFRGFKFEPDADIGQKGTF